MKAGEGFDPFIMPPALVEGTPLGFDGSFVALDEAALTHLRSLGYDPQDFRTAIAARQVELFLQGCLLGTIKFDPIKFKAAESARKHFSKQTKEETEAGLKEKGNRVDIISLLTGGVEPRESGPRRGRPPGKK